MSRTHSPFSIQLLAEVSARPEAGYPINDLFAVFAGAHSRKSVYDAVFRLAQQDLLVYTTAAKSAVRITEDGRALLSTRKPERDGIWKLVIFDIPEKQRPVRTFIRNRLKSLGFKKWQASIWVSPYRLDDKLETELSQLSEKIFIRLIKTTDINNTKDLEQLFSEGE